MKTKRALTLNDLHNTRITIRPDSVTTIWATGIECEGLIGGKLLIADFSSKVTTKARDTLLEAIRQNCRTLSPSMTVDRHGKLGVAINGRVVMKIVEDFDPEVRDALRDKLIRHLHECIKVA